MARFQRWDFGTFLALMHETVPDYERLQDETVAATGTDARRVLELGTGTGETARRVLARHPGAVLVGPTRAARYSTVPAQHSRPIASSCASHARKTNCPTVGSTWSSRRSPSTTSTALQRRSSSGGSPTASHQA